MSNGKQKSSPSGRGAGLPRVTTVAAQPRESNAWFLAVIGLAAIAVGAGIGGAFLSESGIPTPQARGKLSPREVARQLGPVGETCAAPARHVAGLGIGRGRQDNEPSQIEMMIMAEAEVTGYFAEHVRCIINNDRPRFCNPAGRAALADAVNGYLSMRRLAIRRVQHMGGAMMVNPAHREADATFKALTTRPDRPRMSPAIPAVEALTDLDGGVVLDLQNLVRDGYVTPRHFAGFLGLFTPEELAPHLEGLEVTGTACG